MHLFYSIATTGVQIPHQAIAKPHNNGSVPDEKLLSRLRGFISMPGVVYRAEYPKCNDPDYAQAVPGARNAT